MLDPHHDFHPGTQEGALVAYRDVPDFPGYRVGDDGTVWSRWVQENTPGRRGAVTRLSTDWRKLSLKSGTRKYINVGLRRGGRQYTFRLHRLILSVFVGPCPPGMEGCHGPNGVKDNSLANIRWDTPAANAVDRHLFGITPKGEKNLKHKLTDTAVREMRALYKAGGISYQRLGERYGVTKSTAHKAIVGLQWRHI